jgi:hypothetical protein
MVGCIATLANNIMWRLKMKTETTLLWKTDGYGKPEQSLFFGGIWCGSVEDHTKNAEVARNLELKNFYRGKSGLWRAWISSDDNGKELGWYKTKKNAQQALEKAVRKAINV